MTVLSHRKMTPFVCTSQCSCHTTNAAFVWVTLDKRYLAGYILLALKMPIGVLLARWTN